MMDPSAGFVLFLFLTLGPFFACAVAFMLFEVGKVLFGRQAQPRGFPVEPKQKGENSSAGEIRP